ncbi:hypothetical protein OJ253_2195 [Cryptosporidium canis]|uniref:Coatomer subunit epsilon n=1 Tax=Cryptosporidium canis TaxID=195482 RepID=A0A9D5DJS5_9CRYT|nr:hypothetical protein OJ253_2195 [Cryptosporidium canis]
MSLYSEEISEIENCMNSGYYEKVLVLIQSAESIRNRDFDVDTLLELLKFRCRVHLNQVEKDSIGSCYSEAIANQKFGIAAVCLYTIFNLSETTDERRYELINEVKQLYVQNNNKIAVIDAILLLMNLHMNDFKSAQSITENASPDLKIIQVFAFCMMNRYDMAQLLLDDLLENYDSHTSGMDNCHTLSSFKESSMVRIAQAWLQCLKGEYNSSFITYANMQTDFGENSSFRLPSKAKSSQSVIILNGISVVHMQRQHWSDAYELLLNAYEIDPKCQVTLSNLITCSYFLNLRDEPERYIEELRSINCDHPKIACIEAINKSFNSFN